MAVKYFGKALGTSGVRLRNARRMASTAAPRLTGPPKPASMRWKKYSAGSNPARSPGACRQIISSFLRKQESRRFRIQIVLKQQGILDSRFRGNDGNGAV